MTGTLWYAWRRQRTQLLIGLALVVGFAVWAAVERSSLLAYIHGHHAPLCKGWNGTCKNNPWSLGAVFDSTGPLKLACGISMAVPALVGVFWGAPLIGRELESGTYRFALAQGIGPVRWFAVRFAVAAACSAAGAAVLAALVAWWWSPVSNMLSGLYWHDGYIYDATGPAAVACALFGLAAGTAAGLLLRRVIPAMAATLAALFVVRFALFALRLTWLTPVTRISPGTHPKQLIGSARSAGQWGYIAANGSYHDISACEFSGDRLKKCMEQHDFVSRYYRVFPSHDFWTSQWIATAILLVLAAALVALVVVRLRRRAL
ncbi:transporter [Streptomyces montanisoli]|uniref:Transporter n=1 Tax=Streptomyces montanisoli TaxID=2798581 RepID=A0A940MDP6_9ACTN|nr:transporter [Streptomyces montanisoli]MBP0459364.1 transporter [Streptomyces montanisoli]